MTEKTAAQQRDESGKFLPGNDLRWREGESGNPKGSPKKDASITMHVRDILDSDAGKGKTHARVVAEVVVSQLENKKSKAFAQLLKDQQDRLEGKAPDTLTITGPIRIKVIREGSD